MTDQTPPLTEQDTVEVYEDGELVQSRTVAVPVHLDPVVVALRERVARLEERLANAAATAETITPDAATDPGTEAELAKVKGTLASMKPEDEVTP